MPECVYIGTIHTAYKRLEDCPRNVQQGGDIATIVLFEEYAEGLLGLDKHEYIQVLYWLDKGKRDVLIQTRRKDNTTAGTFALRSPHRPNPIGSAVVKLISVSRGTVTVEGLDCLDSTPLLDIKPAIITDIGNGNVAG
jgi:tRNA-Thr(GGU) m(6)t(6)A37 methyltransferase TsaA